MNTQKIDNETLEEIHDMCNLIFEGSLSKKTFERLESLAFCILHHPTILNIKNIIAKEGNESKGENNERY